MRHDQWGAERGEPSYQRAALGRGPSLCLPLHPLLGLAPLAALVGPHPVPKDGAETIAAVLSQAARKQPALPRLPARQLVPRLEQPLQLLVHPRREPQRSSWLQSHPLRPRRARAVASRGRLFLGPWHLLRERALERARALAKELTWPSPGWSAA